jgi:hypothetical protein
MSTKEKIELDKYWVDIARKVLKGRTIKAVNYISEKDADDNLLSNRGLMIMLDNGTMLYPMCDDEGNDFGAIHYTTKEGNSDVLPVL